jgi:DNA repair protein RecO (recombination protein O)
MRVELEPAYILHTRAYRETSLLVYALTQRHGVMHMVCRGARKKSLHLLQPFIKMQLTWSGKSDLVSLNKYEPEKSSYRNDFRTHIQCFYLHELILGLVPKMSPETELFDLYERTLEAMIAHPKDEAVLRLFELHLLDIIGHPLQLEHDVANQSAVSAEAYYRYQPGVGPSEVSVDPTTHRRPWDIVSGQVLIQLNKQALPEQDWVQVKSFLRGLIKYYMDGKPLMTRQLLRAQ